MFSVLACLEAVLQAKNCVCILSHAPFHSLFYVDNKGKVMITFTRNECTLIEISLLKDRQGFAFFPFSPSTIQLKFNLIYAPGKFSQFVAFWLLACHSQINRQRNFLSIYEEKKKFNDTLTVLINASNFKSLFSSTLLIFAKCHVS